MCLVYSYRQPLLIVERVHVWAGLAVSLYVFRLIVTVLTLPSLSLQRGSEELMTTAGAVPTNGAMTLTADNNNDAKKVRHDSSDDLHPPQMGVTLHAFWATWNPLGTPMALLERRPL